MGYLPASYFTRVERDRTSENLTYRFDRTRGRLSGRTDGIAAVAQAIEKRLLTERDVYPIYNRYGLRTEDLIGLDAPYVYAVLQRRIRDSLIEDSRVTGVDGWTYHVQGNVLAVGFTAHTIFGDIDTLTREVDLS